MNEGKPCVWKALSIMPIKPIVVPFFHNRRPFKYRRQYGRIGFPLCLFVLNGIVPFLDQPLQLSLFDVGNGFLFIHNHCLGFGLGYLYIMSEFSYNMSYDWKFKGFCRVLLASILRFTACSFQSELDPLSCVPVYKWAFKHISQQSGTRSRVTITLTSESQDKYPPPTVTSWFQNRQIHYEYRPAVAEWGKSKGLYFKRRDLCCC